MKEVADNELADRAQPSYWMYRVQKQMEQQTLTTEQIETSAGPVYRLLAIDGKPLNQEQKQQEEGRLDAWLRDTAEQKRAKKEHDDNDQRLQRLMVMLPDAFLYEANGSQGTCAKVKFRPNPGFVPPTYEARMLHGLEGEMWIDLRQKRFVHISGELIDKVEFGYGLLGHLDKGGTFTIDRQQVAPGRWRMQRADVHISGRLLFLKTLNRLQHEERTDFHPISQTLTLTEASDLLRKVTLPPNHPPA